MQTRTLGSQGLTVSTIGYGSMGTVMGYGPSDDTESITAIRTAAEQGVDHFDSAELYGWGEGEQLLGQALTPMRDEVTIATKFGFTPSGAPNSQLSHVRDVVHNSLRNLGTDHIDVLYQHVHDPEVPIEDVVGVMAEFVEAGKVRYLGLSRTTPENVRAAHAVHPISVVQHEYSLFARESEQFFPVLEELGIGFVAYSPLARGFLTGAVKSREHYAPNDVRQSIPWWAPEHFADNLRIVEQLAEIAATKDASLSQLALAWLIAKKEYIVPIPGSRNAARVAENVAAARLTLNQADVDSIEALIS